MQEQGSSSGQLESAPFVQGTIIGERFEVIKALPSKEKRSYICRRLTAPRQGELVVLKLLAQADLGEYGDTATKRFQHEIVAAMSIRHPNVVRMDETVKDKGRFGYIVEYVEGKSLLQILENKLPSALEVILYLRQLCAATQAIHNAGIIHRNLKPKSIVITESHHLKLTDFGLVKIMDQAGITEAGMVLGTVDYLSPDYVMGAKADYQLDVYAVGVIGYEMLTGGTPFFSTNIAQMFNKRATMDPERPEIRNPECPRELADVVLRAIQRDPIMRYRSPMDMQADLENLPGFENLELPKPPKVQIRPVIPLKEVVEEPKVEAREAAKAESKGFAFWRK